MSQLDKPGDNYQPLKTPTGETDKPAEQYVYGIKRWLITVSVTLVTFLTLLDTTIIVTAIPKITTDFSSLSDVGWYGSAYLIASCSLQPVTGKMFSTLSVKYTFLAFLALFEAGSAVCGAAQSSSMLIAGRTIAGLGCSGLRNGALTITAKSIPLKERPLHFGIMMGISLLGAVAGPLLGGAFTNSVSWRWCFYVNLPIGGAAAILLLLIHIPDNIKDTTTPETTGGILGTLSKLDPIGFFLFAPVAVMLLMALEWGGSQYAWNSATIIGLFIGAGLMCIVFLSWEYYKGEDAMIPLSMVTNRAIWSSCLVIWFLFGAMMVYSYYLPIYFQAVRGASAIASGVDILPLIISQLVASIASGGSVPKIGYYLPFTIACGILLIISGALMSTLQVDTSTGKWVGFQIIGGFGQGLGMQMPFIAVQHAVPEETNAVALALLVFMQNFGGAILLAIAEAIFDHELMSGLAKYAPDVDPSVVEAAGAAGFRNVLQPAQLGGVLSAYNSALIKEFYLAIASAAATLLVCWGMGWVNIAKAKQAATASEHQLETLKEAE
ncbi:major facilitator superfamily-domain-containing protein [Xylariales sp. PMI_506]|nr:major facilitator superfamily-domain-containing protein [Xylariales sp. PMI_506]